MRKTKAGKKGGPKLTVKEFVLRAIEMLQKGKYRTIHVVYSGFNQAFREYFAEEGLDPVVEVKKLAEEGAIQQRVVRGGALIGLPGSMKEADDASGALKKMGLK